ncbi:phage terminase large subunit family protein [Atlantibacter subterraneus]|uniref:phage terminase large subunit family protein n=1 Tax=Atlantibacter subterraneus TaxID=255519 RepID=UPI0022EA4262|nr:terminase gpA endonuclease subunit [Atlantibacter subterranea]MDA3133448.1 phage terminase large subunit family protein [Atlantibacter subterranea]
MTNIDKLKNIFKACSTFIQPPPVLSPSEWCEANLTVVDGPQLGQKLKLFPFQKEMIDAIQEGKRKIVFKTSAQIGKTSILNGILFYQMKHSGNNIGVLQASVRELNQWINSKIKPTIQQTPCLAEMVTNKNDKEAVNNLSQIQLKSGQFIYMMSLGSPKHLRGKTLQTILLDEISAVPVSSSEIEGDPVLIAEQRSTAFGEDVVIVLSSTPTSKDDPIDKNFQASDQRYFYVPCPHCDHQHVLKWENVKFEWHQVQGKRLPNVGTAKYHCPECKKAWSEGDRLRAVSRGKFKAHNPMSTVAGFHLSRLYSPMATIKSIVQDYADCYQNFSLQTFYQTSLGETYSDLIEDPGVEAIEKLKTDISLTNIPADTLFIAGGCDQQLDRLELTLLGVSEKNIYLLSHQSFYDINCERVQSPAYTKLINFLKNDFRDVNGNKIPMLWCNLDSSNGKATSTVYRNCNRYSKLHAIKGSSTFTAPLIPEKASRIGGQELYVLGVSTGKTVVRELLNRNINATASTKFLITSDVPDDWAEQLLSEELKKMGTGVRWVLSKGKERNEALDCLVYSICAMNQVLRKTKWEKLRAYKARINADDVNPTCEPEKATEDDLTPQEPLKFISTKQPEPERKVLKPDRPVSRRPKQTGWISRR